MKTDLIDGFRLDHGFQVLLTAYPELATQVDMKALDLQAFDPGALVWISSKNGGPGKGHVVSDPFRKPSTLFATTFAPIGSVIDKLRDGLGDVTSPALFAMVISVVGMSTGTLVQRSRGKDMPLITGTAAQDVSSGAVLLIASSLFETWEFHLTGEMILALLWFGLGQNSLIFVLVHSVLWALALNTYAGFLGVSETLRMAGRNYGLKGLRLVLFILIPAALPSILSGLKIGWAFAWRTLIAAELVFGASSGKGGLGWYIFQNRNELYTDKVFAGLAVVILIGLLVESLVFNTLERVTVRRWGMQR